MRNLNIYIALCLGRGTLTSNEIQTLFSVNLYEIIKKLISYQTKCWYYLAYIILFSKKSEKNTY